MSDLYDACKAQFERLRESIDSKLSDGKLRFRELVGVLREFSSSAAVIAETMNVPGPEKRALVVEAAELWWSEDLEPLDMPGPDAIFDPIIRAAIPGIVGALVDAFVDVSNQTGWPE